MSHIARIGRRSPKVRAGYAVLYAVLLVGAVTTLYPFLLMVATGAKSQVDYTDYSARTLGGLVPAYLTDTRALFTKYAEDRYANNLDDIGAAYSAEFDKPQSVAPPADAGPDALRLADSWAKFQATLPLTFKKAGFGEHDAAPSALLLRYRAHLRGKFGTIEKLNEAWTEENVGFETVFPPFERTTVRDWTPDLSVPKVADWNEFKAKLPADYLVVLGVDPAFRTYLKQDVYEEDLAKLNAAWATDFKSWTEVTLPRIVPRHPGQRADWEAFVRAKFPLRMLTIAEPAEDPAARNAWRAFLAKRGRPGTASAPLPSTLPADKEARADWAAFVAGPAPLDRLAADSPENLWRASGFPDRLHGDARADMDGTPFSRGGKHVSVTQPPQALVDWRYVQANAGPLRWDYATRNFKYVTGYLLFGRARAIANTVIFCVLAILTALIVNPLCAYALSRYPLPYGYQVLLFLLATMAFPAEVAMIPNFLLLKQLGFLNTFYALVLPGMANGFSIFLLKGFFDSLPRELYEAGIIDGATELGMFRTITVPLSLPIFSVIALNAFTASYGAFLFAMVVCQDPRMWTLMVWLYDLQSTAPQYVMMAALTLAALPTLIVFLLAQKVIMRGIILPSFK